MNELDEGAFPELQRRYFAIAVDRDGELMITPARTTVEGAVRDAWALPYPTGEAGMSIFSIECDDDEIRVEYVPDTPVTDEVAEAARRMVSGDDSVEDRKIIGGGADIRDVLDDLSGE